MSRKRTPPALSYLGGKWRLADWIISHFPDHRCYVEPFCGAASILLRKAPAKYEYANDADAAVVNFFEALRSHPRKLIEAIELTPYSKQEYLEAWARSDDPLEDARRFYIRSWQGRNGGNFRKTGWRYQVNGGPSAVGKWLRTHHLWGFAERLKSVAFECDDAFQVLRRYDSAETLFYVDPPYLGSTRYQPRAYRKELNSEEDHRRLGHALNGLAGMVVLSGYPSTLYEELYETTGWTSHAKKSKTDRRTREERLWINPACAERLTREAEKSCGQKPFELPATSGPGSLSSLSRS